MLKAIRFQKSSSIGALLWMTTSPIAFLFCPDAFAQHKPPTTIQEFHLQKFSEIAARALKKPGAGLIVVQSRADEFARNENLMSLWQQVHRPEESRSGKWDAATVENLPSTYLRWAGVTLLRTVPMPGTLKVKASVIYVQVPPASYEISDHGPQDPWPKPHPLFIGDDGVYLLIVVPGGDGEVQPGFPKVPEFVKLFKQEKILASDNWFRLADPDSAFLIDAPGVSTPLPRNLPDFIKEELRYKLPPQATSPNQIFVPRGIINDLNALHTALKQGHGKLLASSDKALARQLKTTHGLKVWEELAKPTAASG